jgi:uncharacterized protein (DUF2236 family)
VNLVKRRIVEDLLAQTGRHDAPHIFGGPPGDPGLVGPGSMSWELHRDIASVLVAGTAAIVLEILHPSVMAGVQDLSNYREEPLRRGKTTFGYVVTTTFGNTQAATRLINAVKRMHSRVEGTRPDGVPYRALDPELIAWVHTCIPWMVMTAYDRYRRPLSDDERNRYLAEQAVIGRMGGADRVPETVGELEDYVEAMRPRLAVTDQTLEFFDFLLHMPFGPPGPGRLQVETSLSIMPAWARRLAGFETSGIVHRAVHDPALRLSARTIRWAFGTPPYALEADRRVAGVHAGARHGGEDDVVAGPDRPAGEGLRPAVA